MRWLHCTALPLALLLHFVVAAEVLLVASLAEVDAEQETDALLTPAQALLRAVPASGRCAGDYKPRNRGLSASVARAAAIKLVYHAYAVCSATFQLSSAEGVRDRGMEVGEWGRNVNAFVIGISLAVAEHSDLVACHTAACNKRALQKNAKNNSSV